MTRPAPGPIVGTRPGTETPTQPRTPVRLLPDDPGRFYSWQDQSACRGADGRLFFASESEKGGEKERREAAALKICATCPVRAVCVEHALSTPETAGVWGMTEAELATELVRRRKRRGRR